MTALDPQMDRLANALDELATIIEAYGEAHDGDVYLSTWVASDAQNRRSEAWVNLPERPC